MITFERTTVMNMDNAIRGARNPMNSWDRSDSYMNENNVYVIGPNDMELLKKLRASGTDHRKYLRQILISVDITAPLYWWKEFDTYKVGTVANSCSTMHRITSKPIDLSCFSCEKMSPSALKQFQIFVSQIEAERLMYLDAINTAKLNRIDGHMGAANLHQDSAKQHWWNIIQMLPSSWQQMRTVTLNYEVCNNIVKSRSDHKQDEWRIAFMEWMRSLPYSEELIFGKED